MGRREKTYRIESQEQLNDFLLTVKGDLEFLRQLDLSNPTTTLVRIAASIMRRLLGDGMYEAAWHFVDREKEPCVAAIDLLEMIGGIEPKYIEYAYAGGARTSGAQHRGHVLLRIPKEEIEAEGEDVINKRIHSNIRVGERRNFRLQEFCQSASVVSGRSEVSRLGIIQYVANKLGGVHWDNKRSAWVDPVGERHRLLDEQHLIVGKITAPHFELVSIADDLRTSSDAEELIDRISGIVPEPDYSENILKFREGRSGPYADMTFSEPE